MDAAEIGEQTLYSKTFIFISLRVILILKMGVLLRHPV